MTNYIDLLHTSKNGSESGILIDLDLLQKQKMCLHAVREAVSNKRKVLLDGLIEMCDRIQDLNEWRQI